jgi:L-ribulokinase
VGKRYAIGLDFGTKSGRAILVDIGNGDVIASSEKNYAHGVMDNELFNGIKLGTDWALQYPDDYVDVLEHNMHAILSNSGINPENIIGLSIDFTASTILPVDKNLVPLCDRQEFTQHPHAYAKLWKHHAAQKQANKINGLLQERGWLNQTKFGGRISSELLLPKVLQMVEEDPDIYQSADQILEASDWLTQLMTGSRKRTSSMAAYKAMWDEADGYPPNDFFRQLNPLLDHFTALKLTNEICPVGSKIGELNTRWALRLGLAPGTAVGASIIDAHAGLPGCGISKPGQMMLIIGTSTVQAALSELPYAGSGILCGIKGGIIPGYYALESGLAAVGDAFGWFVNNCVPSSYENAAREQNLSVHQFLTGMAAKLKPGQSGLISLDWWNGNKTPYIDGDRSGLILGYTLQTKPEEIYRALIESTAYGTRLIMETFEKSVQIDEIIACGGIANKNELLLQIYADVTQREIKVSDSDQTAALGAAMYAAVAAGQAKGGYDSMIDATVKMSKVRAKIYKPQKENAMMYNKLYQEYLYLTKQFGPDSHDVMKNLKEGRKGI